MKRALLRPGAGGAALALERHQRPLPLPAADGQLGVRVAAEVVHAARVGIEEHTLVTPVQLALVAASVWVLEVVAERLLRVRPATEVMLHPGVRVDVHELAAARQAARGATVGDGHGLSCASQSHRRSVSACALHSLSQGCIWTLTKYIIRQSADLGFGPTNLRTQKFSACTTEENMQNWGVSFKNF